MSARQYTDQLQKLDTPFYFYDMQLLADTLAKAVAEAEYDRCAGYANFGKGAD